MKKVKSALRWFNENPGLADVVIGFYREADSEVAKETVLQGCGLQDRKAEVERMIYLQSLIDYMLERKKSLQNVEKELQNTNLSDEEKVFVMGNIEIGIITSPDGLAKAMQDPQKKEYAEAVFELIFKDDIG